MTKPIVKMKKSMMKFLKQVQHQKAQGGFGNYGVLEDFSFTLRKNMGLYFLLSYLGGMKITNKFSKHTDLWNR